MLLPDLKMKAIQKRVHALEKMGLSSDKDIETWFKLKTIYHMYEVCDAYYRGSLFYRSDENHFLNKKNTSKEDEYHSSISSLNLIKYTNDNAEIIVDQAYAIDQSCLEPANILKQILFSYTVLDCNGAISLAHYMTLLDFLIVKLGRDKGEKQFNALFAPKLNSPHHLNQFRIGTMGSSWTGDWTDFSPLYFFMKEEKITLKTLMDAPFHYLGSHINIGGHPDYLTKHPKGYTQSWNTIFIGLHHQREPLFLAAGELGKNYIVTYNEMLNILTSGFNKIPTYTEKQYILAETKPVDLIGLEGSIAVNIDVKKLTLLIDKPQFFLKCLSEYCDHWYQKEINARGFVSELEHFDLPKLRKFSTDDHDKDALSLVKLIKESLVTDDINLRYASKNVSKQGFFSASSNSDEINEYVECIFKGIHL